MTLRRFFASHGRGAFPAALITALLVSTALSIPATAQSTATGSQATLELERCHLDGLSDEVRCGTFDVLENPDDPNSRTITLNLAVAPAEAPDPKPDPIFILAGGPGQAATEIAPQVIGAFRDLRKTRDLVFVDQRGTGQSNPLDCELGDDLDLTDEFPSQVLIDCQDTLREKADLTRYTTFHAMPDLELVRQALGYGPINLWGASYGTRAAMVFQELFPESTRSVILDGAAPFEVTLPLYFARDAQRALDMLFDDCEADDACKGRFPDLRSDFDTLVTRLGEEPVEFTIPHPRTGEPTTMTATAQGVSGALRGILYSTQAASLVPLMIQQALDGDFRTLAATGMVVGQSFTDTMSLGMLYSVVCTEDYPRIDREQIASVTADTFLGAVAIEPWMEVCEGWTKAELPAGFENLSTSQVPALLLSGDADPVVPPEWAESVRSFLPNSLHVIVPGIGHNTSHVGCVPDLITDFVEAASVADLDASCVESIERPPFFVSFAGSEP